MSVLKRNPVDPCRPDLRALLSDNLKLAAFDTVDNIIMTNNDNNILLF